jgi:hypothetical protein
MWQGSAVLALRDLMPDAPAVALEAIALAIGGLALPAYARRRDWPGSLALYACRLTEDRPGQHAHQSGKGCNAQVVRSHPCSAYCLARSVGGMPAGANHSTGGLALTTQHVAEPLLMHKAAVLLLDAP